MHLSLSTRDLTHTGYSNHNLGFESEKRFSFARELHMKVQEIIFLIDLLYLNIEYYM